MPESDAKDAAAPALPDTLKVSVTHDSIAPPPNSSAEQLLFASQDIELIDARSSIRRREVGDENPNPKAGNLALPLGMEGALSGIESERWRSADQTALNSSGQAEHSDGEHCGPETQLTIEPASLSTGPGFLGLEERRAAEEHLKEVDSFGAIVGEGASDSVLPQTPPTEPEPEPETPHSPPQAPPRPDRTPFRPTPCHPATPSPVPPFPTTNPPSTDAQPPYRPALKWALPPSTTNDMLNRMYGSLSTLPSFAPASLNPPLATPLSSLPRPQLVSLRTPSSAEPPLATADEKAAREHAEAEMRRDRIAAEELHPESRERRVAVVRGVMMGGGEEEGDGNALVEWMELERRAEGMDRECIKRGRAMREMLEKRSTGLIGEAKSEQAKRVNIEAENEALRKELRDHTEGVPKHEVEDMKRGYELRLKQARRKHEADAMEISDSKRRLKILNRNTKTEMGRLKVCKELRDENLEMNTYTIQELKERKDFKFGRLKVQDRLIQNLKERNRTLVAESNGLVSRQDTIRKENSELRRRNVDLEKQSKDAADTEHERNELKRQLEYLKNKIEHCERDNRLLRAVANSKIEDESIQKELRKRDAKTKILEDENQILKLDQDIQGNETESHQRKIDEMRHKGEIAKRPVEELEDNEYQLKSQAYQSENRILKKNLVKLEAEIKKLTESLANCKQKYDKTEHWANEPSTPMEEGKRSHEQDEEAKLQAEIQRLTTELQDATRGNENWKARYQELQEAQNELSAQFRELRTSYNVLAARKEAVEQQASHRIGDLEDEIDEYKENIVELRKETAEMHLQIKKLGGSESGSANGTQNTNGSSLKGEMDESDPDTSMAKSRGGYSAQTILPPAFSPYNQRSRVLINATLNPPDYKGPRPFRESLIFAVTRCDAALREMRDIRAQRGFQPEDTVQAAAIAKEIFAASYQLSDIDEKQQFKAKGAYLQGVVSYYGDEIESARNWFMDAGLLNPEEYPSEIIDAWIERIEAEGSPPQEAAYYRDRPRHPRRGPIVNLQPVSSKKKGSKTSSTRNYARRSTTEQVPADEGATNYKGPKRKKFRIISTVSSYLPLPWRNSSLKGSVKGFSYEPMSDLDVGDDSQSDRNASSESRVEGYRSEVDVLAQSEIQPVTFGGRGRNWDETHAGGQCAMGGEWWSEVDPSTLSVGNHNTLGAEDLKKPSRGPFAQSFDGERSKWTQIPSDWPSGEQDEVTGPTLADELAEFDSEGSLEECGDPEKVEAATMKLAEEFTEAPASESPVEETNEQAADEPVIQLTSIFEGTSAAYELFEEPLESHMSGDSVYENEEGAEEVMTQLSTAVEPTPALLVGILSEAQNSQNPIEKSGEKVAEEQAGQILSVSSAIGYSPSQDSLPESATETVAAEKPPSQPKIALLETNSSGLVVPPGTEKTPTIRHGESLEMQIPERLIKGSEQESALREGLTRPPRNVQFEPTVQELPRNSHHSTCFEKVLPQSEM